MARTQRTVTKVKKKRWVQVFAPKYLNEALIGDSHVSEPENLLKRKVSANLMSLTHDMKKQNINVRFIVNRVVGEKAYTAFDGYHTVPSSIKRMIRRGKNRIDYTFFMKTKDGVDLKLNVIIVTNATTYKPVGTKIRHQTYLAMKKIIESQSLSEFVSGVINRRVQDVVKQRLRKVYPVRIFDVRTIDIVREKHHDLLEKEEEAAAEMAEQNKESEETVESKEAAEPADAEPEAKKEADAEEPATAEEEPAPEKKIDVEGEVEEKPEKTVSEEGEIEEKPAKKIDEEGQVEEAAPEETSAEEAKE